MSPALVGIGAVLASSPGLPLAASTIGQTAVEQGRYVDPKFPAETTGSVPTTSQVTKDQVIPRNKPEDTNSNEEDSDIEQSETEEDVEAYGRALFAAREAAAKADSSIRGTLKPPPSPTLGRRNTVSSLRKLVADKIEPRPSHRRTISNRPTASSPSLPNLYLPAIPLVRPAHVAPYQSRLLRSHYLHSEVQFLQTLSAIS